MDDLKALFRSFRYAFQGIFWMVGHERNFRVHLTCMAYMFYYLLRYNFFSVTRTQFAILLLACGLVIGGEMLNTGVEKADDTVSDEKRKTIKISKDTSAGAVLVFAFFAVLVGIVILWQPDAFKALYLHYLGSPVSFILFIASVIVATIFIFKFDFKKENK